MTKYVGTDTDDQILSVSSYANTVTLEIEDGNSVSFDLPSDFVSRAGGPFQGSIYATNISGLGNLRLDGNLTMSGVNPVQFTSLGNTTLTLPTSGTLATEDFVNNSVVNNRSLTSGSMWVGVDGVATALPIAFGC